MWEENQGISLFLYYFHTNKGREYILLVRNGKNDDVQRKATEYIRHLIKDTFHILSVSF